MRKVEIFSAGCPACDEVIQQVKAETCPSCGVEVRDMNDPAVAKDAKRYGISRVPAVVIDGKLASCCASGGKVDMAVLRSMGLGQP